MTYLHRCVPDLRPHVRCSQCCRFIPSDESVAMVLDGLATLCDECYEMRLRAHNR
jgi:hypothetical protein